MEDLKQNLIAAARKATQREKRRKRAAKLAQLERMHAVTDKFFASLPEALEQNGEARFLFDELHCSLHKGEWVIHPNTIAAFVKAKCQKLGLKTTVDVDSDTVGYSVRTSCALVVKLA